MLLNIFYITKMSLGRVVDWQQLHAGQYEIIQGIHLLHCAVRLARTSAL